jgi:hypothetical protein
MAANVGGDVSLWSEVYPWLVSAFGMRWAR